MKLDQFAHQIIRLDKDNLTHNVWGGNWILKWKGMDPVDTRHIGESWEVSCHQDNPSIVTLSDRSRIPLKDLIEAAPVMTGGKGLIPFLFKVIDARENLSIQVHPSNEYAKKHERDNGKAESWVILETGPNEDDGYIYLGFRSRGIPPEKFKKEIQDPNGDVLQFLNKVKVKAGDVYDLPPGWIHAIGKGVRIAEIQQNSNVTYRVWDWNRKNTGRVLHVDKAMDVLDFTAKIPHHMIPSRITVKPDKSFVEEALVKSDIGGYQLNRVQLEGEGSISFMATKGMYFTLTVMSGSLSLKYRVGDSPMEPWGDLREGETVFVPATLGAVQLEPTSEKVTLFKCLPT